MKIFLRLKHWQLFGIFVVIPVFAQVTVEIFFDLYLDQPDIGERLSSIIFALGLVYEILWISAGVTLLHRHLPNDVKIDLNKFKTCLYSEILIYLTYEIVFMGNESVPRQSMLVYLLLWVGFACHLFVSHQAAVNLVSIEKGRETTFKEQALTFICFVFPPIGVWFIQPRINRINEKV